MATPVEVAWFAGLFEGEGCIHVRHKGVGSDRYNAVSLTIGSTDKDVIERCQRLMGGVIGSHTPQGYGHKTMWDWRVSNKGDCLRVLDLIESHMGLRRSAKIKEARQVLASINPAKSGWKNGQRLEIEHGTYRGYRRHLAQKVPVCEACAAASRAYARERQMAKEREEWAIYCATVANKAERSA